MNLLIIPARGGSKRIPRKNIKHFQGKPIIEWTINESKKLKIFDKFIVSTDDDEIARVAKDFGAEVPFKRPKKLSDDFTNTKDVINHCISWLNESRYIVKNACCIYPTAPLIFDTDIIDAKKILDSTEEEILVFAATSFPYPIQRAIYI